MSTTPITVTASELQTIASAEKRGPWPATLDAYLPDRSPTGKALVHLCSRATLLDKFTMSHPTDAGARLTISLKEKLFEDEAGAMGAAFKKWGARP